MWELLPRELWHNKRHLILLTIGNHYFETFFVEIPVISNSSKAAVNGTLHSKTITPSAAGLNSFILAYFYYMEKKFDVPGILHLESKVWYICRWSVMKFLILEWWSPPVQWPEVFGQISFVKWLKIFKLRVVAFMDRHVGRSVCLSSTQNLERKFRAIDWN